MRDLLRRSAVRALPAWVAALSLLTFPGAAHGQDQPCGTDPKDWCPAAPGDPCGAHRNEQACRADPACRGRKYGGESVVACLPDDRGFWTNCPAVGCVRRAEAAGQPPRSEIVKKLCSAKGTTEIRVWRNSASAAAILEQILSRKNDPISILTDVSGNSLLVTSVKPTTAYEREARGHVLHGLEKSETTLCR